MEMDIGLTQPSRGAICEGLTKLLADTYLLYLKTQNYHWNVRGCEFYSLHILFEKQYQELAEATDEIAERIRALGLFVEATVGAFKKHSIIREEDKVLSSNEMLAHLVQGHEELIKRVRKVAEVADQAGDFATVDMIGRRLGAHEKMAWFLRSHLST